MAAVELEPKHTAWDSDSDHVSSTNSESDSYLDENSYGSSHISEVRESDRNVLREEEERETLLSNARQPQSQAGVFGNASHNGANVRKSRRPTAGRKSEKLRRRGKKELMYEMEEGGFKDDTSSQSSSSLADLNTQKHQQPPMSKVRTLSTLHLCS